METQEIRIIAEIILEVPIELNKNQIFKMLHGSIITLPCTQVNFDDSLTEGFMRIFSIEEEAEIYRNE